MPDDLSSLGSLGLGGPPRPTPSACFDSSADLARAAPQLVYQSHRTAIYRLHDTGFKVILDPDPSGEQILKILHEQNISNHLPWACRKRHVTDVTSFNRRPALSFNWASGITLKEWLHKVKTGPEVDLIIRLRAAMAIARTLSEFHDGGVVYNCLTTENIVLVPCRGEYVATLIDLSSALIYRDKNKTDADIDAAFETQVKEGDLKNLGRIINQIFRGEERTHEGQGQGNEDEKDGAEGAQDPNQRKRSKQHALGEGLPLYLNTLISALIDTSNSPDDGYGYVNAHDVFLDLNMLSHNADGCLGKSELDVATLNSRLRLQGGMFYGRQVQMSMLLPLFQSAAELGKSLMATISGYPGTGKSTLVNQIRQPLIDMNGCFITGKFDKNTHPDTVLASSLNCFFGDILEADKGNRFISMKWRIQEALGSMSNNVLLEILPNLQNWMVAGSEATENAAPSSCVKGTGSSHRLKFMFCNLIGAIACKAHPLVLFLDDLQWADETTLDIVRMMMMDPGICHFLFLGCYRDNEVNVAHPLTAKLKAIQEQGTRIVTIQLGPIEKKCVNTLLSDVLCMPPSLCRPLANVVHSKTGGIILFVLRFLACLNNDGNLWFCMSSRRWMFNLEDIRLKKIHGDVVSHMTEYMKKLSKKMQRGLKFAACLGPIFEAKVLEKAKKNNELEDSFLESCIEFGLLQNPGSNLCQFVWAHDQIQQAAYNLIPLSKREAFHLLVGSRMFVTTSSHEMEVMIFFIVDNLNRGVKLIDDPNRQYGVSKLNLQAGEKALSSSAFVSASKYLLMGLSLLGPKSWEDHYNHTLRLYDAASEALFVIGDFVRLSELIDEPLANARSFEDKLNIFNNLVRALAASSKFEEGIGKCMSILTQLGEDIPTEITSDVYFKEASHVKQLLHEKSRQELLSLPMISDTHKLAAMQFMNHALTMTFIAKPLLNPIIVLRMVKMSIEHGICNISVFAFACYGALLVSEPSCDVEGGVSMGRFATEMMKRLDATEMTPRLCATVYGFINIWKEPWQAGQDKHLEAYDSGVQTGDMEYATTNLFQYTSTAIYGCGENLESISQKIQSYSRRAFQCNQQSGWISLVILHQLTLDLMGIKLNALSLYSRGMTEESCFTRCHENNEVSICRYICNKKKYVAFLRGDLATARELYEQNQDFPIVSTGRLVGFMVSVFIDGMIGFVLARNGCEDKEKWTKLGSGAIQTLKKWVKSSAWNFSNKLHLLEAESFFLTEDDEKAMASYHDSIQTAHEHRFVHEEGLAEEKFATYLLHKSKNDDAMRHFTNAKNCYKVWGAQILVRRMDKAIELLQPLCTGRS